MNNFSDPNNSPKSPRVLRVLATAWHWLTEPSSPIIEPEHRLQARLLMAMLLVLIITGLLSLTLSLLGIYAQAGDSESVGLTFPLDYTNQSG